MLTVCRLDHYAGSFFGMLHEIYPKHLFCFFPTVYHRITMWNLDELGDEIFKRHKELQLAVLCTNGAPLNLRHLSIIFKRRKLKLKKRGRRKPEQNALRMLKKEMTLMKSQHAREVDSLMQRIYDLEFKMTHFEHMYHASQGSQIVEDTFSLDELLSSRSRPPSF